MKSWFEGEKWTEEKIENITRSLYGLIVDSYSRVEVLFPDGGFDDEWINVRDIEIKQEWVGGILSINRHYLVCPINEKEPHYNLEIITSGHDPRWATIYDFKHAIAANYEYDELLEAVKRIKAGLVPYEYNVVLAKDEGLPIEYSFDYDPNNILPAKTERITRFGGKKED